MVFIGVDIGGTTTAVSLGQGDGTILKKEQFATVGTPQEILEKCASIIETYQKIESITAIGISCGGPLDSVKGVIQSPPNLPGWDEIEAVSYFEDRFGVSTYLENDANACALAEWYWGAGKGSSSMIFLTFGTGLGAGLILDSRLYRGVNGLAGEVGHIRIATDGPECYYKKGSWESYCSGCGISGLYELATQECRSAKEICLLAEQGDPIACDVIHQSGSKLGLGIAMLIDLLNVERIIIGSIFERSEGLFRSTMEEVIEQEALQVSRKSCTILPSALGDSLGDMAALGVARDGYQRSKHND